jgi:ribosome-binding factor A
LKHPYFGDVAPRDARKLAQLVREASRALAQSLSTLDDPHLASACLLEVRPHPDASCLAVCVSAGAADLADVRAALERARGMLRDDLAAAIARRRTPSLVFEVVP